LVHHDGFGAVVFNACASVHDLPNAYVHVAEQGLPDLDERA
jgi:hypothetical protein